MTGYIIPPLLIDPQTLPPPLLTSEPGSFAHNTFAVRIPRIAEETIEQNDFAPEICDRIEALRDEILNGRVRPLEEETPDREFWNTLSRNHIGRSWLDAPWYWAETFFYRRMLEATRYFQPGPTFLFDPYAVTKESELQPDVAPLRLAQTLSALPEPLEERFEAYWHTSLWGNRADLSYRVAANVGRAARLQDELSNLLVDDTPRVWEFLQSRQAAEVALIEDNAGTETVMDLGLIDLLLSAGLARRVVFHLKPQPFFVSDTMPKDVYRALDALEQANGPVKALAGRIRGYLEQGRLELYAHWFYPTCLFYFQMPGDLIARLRASDLVILKGDVNYRRVLGDAHWDPATPLAYVARYFPAPLVALRVLKAEEVVGLAPGQAERLDRTDPGWMTNGRRGLIQARL